MNNYRPISILRTFYKIFENSHTCARFTPSEFQIQSPSAWVHQIQIPIDKSFCFLDSNTLLVNSQSQVDAIYLDFSNAFYLVQHAMLLHKRDETGLPAAYVT